MAAKSPTFHNNEDGDNDDDDDDDDDANGCNDDNIRPLQLQWQQQQ